jgi:hypothetical protein
MIGLRRNKNLPSDSKEIPEYEKWELIQKLMQYHDGRTSKRRLIKMLLSGEPIASGGMYFQDARPPWLMADTATVTLLTTQKQLWSTADLTPTFQTDWWDGKQFMLRCFGRITTPAGAGTLTYQLGYGVADGTAGALATSAPLTAIASQANMSWRFEGRVRCRSRANVAASAILMGTGILEFNTAVVAAGQGLMPATAAAQVTGLNLAQTSGIHLQCAEAATTGATVVIHDLEFTSNN